jgi:dUTP pyrophosphatase
MPIFFEFINHALIIALAFLSSIIVLVKIKVKRVKKDAILPKCQTKHSAGMDFYACINQPITIKPLESAVIPTGISVAIPMGFELQIRCRSGLAFKHNIGMIHGLGTIDADFRDEMQVLLFNFSKNNYVINPGDRIAQAVVARFETVEWEEVKQLDKTERGGGFGSTGK